MLMILFFFIGLLVFFYPTLSNYYNEKNQSRSIYNYENILKDNSSSSVEESRILQKYMKSIHFVGEWKPAFDDDDIF